MATFTIAATELSPSQVLDRISAGMTDMTVSDTEFEGAVGFFLQVPNEFSEIVETAAKRNGVKLERVDGDAVPLGEQTYDFPDGDEGGEAVRAEALKLIEQSEHFLVTAIDPDGHQRVLVKVAFEDSDEVAHFVANTRTMLERLDDGS